MNLRRLSVTALIALIVVGFFTALGRGIGGLDLPDPQSDPVFEQSVVEEPPPILDPAPTAAERQTFWLRMLTTGDEVDVRWSIAQIRRGGRAARDAVRAAAQRSVGMNHALIQQALEILLEAPDPGDFPLARDVLESRDPHGVARAILLLGRLGTVAEPAASRLGTLAVDREYPIPQRALDALVRMGTPAARDAAMEAVSLMDRRQLGFGYVALAAFGGEDVREFLLTAYAAEEEPGAKLAAAEGLLRVGDESPLPWLRSELERTPPGTPHHESTLRILADVADPVVLEPISGRVSDTLDSGERRAQALALLRAFPLQDIGPLLRRVSRQGEPVELRTEAHHMLVQLDAPGAWSDVLSLLDAPGPTNSADRRVGALVLGRVRRPDAGPRVIDALRAGSLEGEERSLYLRALCLSGHVPGAEFVAREVALDTTAFGLGGTGFDVQGVVAEMTPEFSSAFGRAVVRGLEGEFGEPRASGLQFLLLYAPIVAGPEAASAVEGYVTHEDRPVREAAVAALAYIGGRDSLIVLRRAWRQPQDELLRELMRDTMIKLQHRSRR